MSVTAINSNGLVEFPNTHEQPFVNNQVPLESFKTGTNISLATTQNNVTSNLMSNAPIRETKGKFMHAIFQLKTLINILFILLTESNVSNI